LGEDPTRKRRKRHGVEHVTLPSFPFPYPIRFFDVNEKIKKTQAAM
jgi:hypothetical protein